MDERKRATGRDSRDVRRSRLSRALSFSLLLCLPLLALALSGCGSGSHASGLDLLQVRPDDRDPAWISVHLADPAARELRRKLSEPPTAAEAEPYFFLALKERQDVPLVSRLHVMGEELQLIPQAPLTRGKDYVAVFRGSQVKAGLPDLTREYRLPAEDRPSTSRVTSSYPHQAELPCNVFRFYLWFSEPMAEGHLFRHARLLDEAGKPVPQAFHEVELWAEDHRRLTLWLSPGRTKRSLEIAEHAGPVLMPGKSYTLEVAAGLPDQQGRPLAQPFRYRFRTLPADHQQPTLASWQIQAPPAGTREPLRVTFPEPLDRPLVSQLLSVEDHAGAPLGGDGFSEEDGRTWRFTPTAEWSAAELTLVAGGELDDLAGNSLYRAFETPAAEARRPVVEAPVFRRTFRPLTARPSAPAP